MRLFIAICALSVPTLTVAQTTNPYRGSVPPLPTADAGLPPAGDGLDLGNLGGLDSLPALDTQEPFDSRASSPITPVGHAVGHALDAPRRTGTFAAGGIKYAIAADRDGDQSLRQQPSRLTTTRSQCFGWNNELW